MPLSSARERLEENSKQLRSKFISKCQNITKTFKKINNKNQENSREQAKDPFFDVYQDIEGRNNDDKNKIKLIADWSRQTPGLNVIGGTQLRPARQDSSEAILGADQNTFSNEHDRRANASSDSNLNKFNKNDNDVPTYI